MCGYRDDATIRIETVVFPRKTSDSLLKFKDSASGTAPEIFRHSALFQSHIDVDVVIVVHVRETEDLKSVTEDPEQVLDRKNAVRVEFYPLGTDRHGQIQPAVRFQYAVESVESFYMSIVSDGIAVPSQSEML